MSKCRFFEATEQGNECHSWPERVKFMSDEHRTKRCQSRNWHVCIWLTAANPESQNEAALLPHRRLQTVATVGAQRGPRREWTTEELAAAVRMSAAGYTFRAIASALNRHKSSVSTALQAEERRKAEA